MSETPLHIDPEPHGTQTIADRPAVHEVLRGCGPVVRVEAPAGGPAWVVTTDALARQVLSDPRFGKDPGAAPPYWHGRDPALEPPADQMRAVTTVDGEAHRRLRRAQAPAFTRRRLLAGRDRIAEIARGLLEELADHSERTGDPADLVGFAVRLPLLVVCDVLGVPLGDVSRASRITAAMAGSDPAESFAAMAELDSMVGAAIATTTDRSDRTPAEAMTERARETSDLTEEELRYLVTGLIFAGQVTTESFLGFLLAHYLAGHFDRFAASAGSYDEASDEASDEFVTETLRVHPPAPFTLWRFATTEVELGDTTVPAGAPILVDIEGINTDPERYPEPHTLRPHRPRTPILTFGDGPHACLGAQLARLEGRVVLAVLRSEFPDAELVVPFDDLVRDRTDSRSRRLRSVPVRLRRAPDPR